jgi:hypothetical protein
MRVPSPKTRLHLPVLLASAPSIGAAFPPRGARRRFSPCEAQTPLRPLNPTRRQALGSAHSKEVFESDSEKGCGAAPLSPPTQPLRRVWSSLIRSSAVVPPPARANAHACPLAIGGGPRNSRLVSDRNPRPQNRFSGHFVVPPDLDTPAEHHSLDQTMLRRPAAVECENGESEMPI